MPDPQTPREIAPSPETGPLPPPCRSAGHTPAESVPHALCHPCRPPPPEAPVRSRRAKTEILHERRRPADPPAVPVHRNSMNEEVQQLQSEIDRILSTTKFNGKEIFTKAAATGGALTFQVSETGIADAQIGIKLEEMSTKTLGVDSVSVTIGGTSVTGSDPGDQTNARNMIDKINCAIDKVSKLRGTFGAIQNRLEHTINNLAVSTENISAAESRIRDVDMAKEMMAYTKNNILVQSAQAMLAQANQVPQSVLQLLQ